MLRFNNSSRVVKWYTHGYILNPTRVNTKFGYKINTPYATTYKVGEKAKVEIHIINTDKIYYTDSRVRHTDESE